MTSWRLTRNRWRLCPAVAGSGRTREPHLSEHLLAVVYGVCGVNLLQSGLTRWCLMERILRGLGLKAGVE